MIAYAYVLTQLWFPSGLVDEAKEHAEQAQKSEGIDMDHGMKGSFREKLLSLKGWRRIAQAFFMEWKMVWKEILFGFTIAGFISVFIPQSFWNAIFLIGDGGAQESPSFLIVLENALVAPVVAFFTFIGSMGNVPLTAMLWSRDASFGGVVAFLGADLVAAPPSSGSTQNITAGAMPSIFPRCSTSAWSRRASPFTTSSRCSA